MVGVSVLEDNLKDESLILGLLDRHPIGVAAVFKRKIVFASKGLARLFGWRREEMIGRSTRIFFSDRASWEAFGERLYRLLEERDDVVLEWPLQKKDGSPIICEIITRRLRPLGDDWIVLSTIRDITAEKRSLRRLKARSSSLRLELSGALEALRREKDFLRRIIDLVPAGIGVWGPKGPVLKNELLRGLLGENIPREIPHLVGRLIRGAGRVFRFEEEIQGRHLLFTLSPIDDQNILLVVEDLTSCVKMREGLETLAQAKASHLLSQERLALMGRLLAGLTHEINTPLTFMKTNIQIFGAYVEGLRRLLEGAELAGEKRKTIDKIISEIRDITKSLEMGAERIAEIITSVKNLGRKESFNEEIDLGQALHEALILTHNKIKHHLRVFINGEPYNRQKGVPLLGVYTTGRRSLLVQMMVILINNAAEAAQRRRVKGATLEINVEDIYPRVVLTFRDNCGGVPEEELSRIFESFYSTKEEGTGLGLYILKEIVNSLEGTLEVECPKEPEGLLFRIVLSGGGGGGRKNF